MNPIQKRGWWFSADEKRGFAWSEVVGRTYHAAGEAGFNDSVLYLYLGGGIMNLKGKEADEVYKELVKAKKDKGQEKEPANA